MISKQQQKYIHSLHNKKNRKDNQVFLVEGEKNLLELLDSDFEIINFYCSQSFLEKNPALPINYAIADDQAIQKVSTLKTNHGGIAVVKQKIWEMPPIDKRVIVLDGLNDPGNLGTIIRLADWYGISDIVLSPDSVEFYNPKVIMATMGSFTRVRLHYLELTGFLQKTTLPVYGAFLEGTNIHKEQFPPVCCIVIGSESHGISAEVAKFIDKPITIPRIGLAESLNAGIATGIILDNVFRNS